MRLSVYDIHGQIVMTLVDEEQHEGEYDVRFDGSDLPTGIYFVRLIIGDKMVTKKIIMIDNY